MTLRHSLQSLLTLFGGLLCGLCCVTQGATAQAPTTPRINWTVTNTASTSSGLPSDELVSLRFTADGKLWVSTNIAFASYDGTNWHTYGADDGLTWGEVLMGKVYIDPQQNVWLTSDEHGMARIDPTGAVKLYMPSEEVEQGLASELVLDIVQDNKQGYYISNWAQFGTTLSYLSAEGVWQHYNFNIVGSNPFDKLLCLAYDTERGVLYGGTLFSGVMYFDGEQFVPLTEEYQTSVSELTISGDTLYAATDLGLMRVDLVNKAVVSMMTTAEGLADNFSTSVAVDAQGAIWVGSDGAGVTRISPQGETTIYNTTNGLSANDINAIAFSPQTGRPYLATRHGGVCYQTAEGSWHYIGSNGLASNSVNGMLFDGTDQWYATSAGVSHFDGKIWHNHKLQREDNKGFAKEYISRILMDSRPDKKNVWVSGYGGVAQYNMEQQEWQIYPYTTTIEKEGESPTTHYPQIALMQTTKGDFWVTTFGERLGFGTFKPEDGSFSFYNDTNISVLPAGCNSFFTAVEAPDESIWFCSVDGILIRDKAGEYRMERFPIEIQVTDPNTGKPVTGYDNNVRNVTFAPDGKVWISKLSGIIIYDPKSGDKVAETGPADDPMAIVTKIVFDKEGNAFIGTLLDGLFVRTKEGLYRHLDESYGLGLKQQIFDLYMREGKLYVCTDLGVFVTTQYGEIIEQIRANQPIESGIAALFKIYPNPTTDYVILPSEALQYRLIDMQGALILTGSDCKLHQINLQGVPAGRYILSYLVGEQWINEQLIVK